MKRTLTSEGTAASRQHLVRRLLEQLERTFTTEGHEAALSVVTDLLGRLDDDGLRAYAYQQGIRSEDEFEGAEPDRGVASPVTT